MDEKFDGLRLLEKAGSLSEKLRLLHQFLRERFDFVDHISVAMYDSPTDLLKTFIDSDSGQGGLSNYQAKLANAFSLKQILATGRPRVVDDLRDFADSKQAHTQWLLAAGYRSSYTLPMVLNDEFFGFIFFDSITPNSFRPKATAHLDPFARLLAAVIIGEIRAIRTLSAVTRTARHMLSRRDSETGAHLERMSRYCRLIARKLAPTLNLSDEWIEHLFLFAPLHDIGKIAIPDSVLLKPGALDAAEWEVMKTHTQKGLDITEFMLKEFGFGNLAHLDILRNVVYCHHEAADGSGYPRGLKGEEIPIEARMVATADVFDALTSARPYKTAWSNDVAFAELGRLATTKLYGNCVQALIQGRQEVEEIQRQFQESVYG